jgi:hypothetical protein
MHDTMSALYVVCLVANFFMTFGLHSWTPVAPACLAAIWTYLVPYNTTDLGLITGALGLLAATLAAGMSAYHDANRSAYK